MRALGELITAPVAFRTHDRILAYMALRSVLYRNKLQQRDIPTLDVGCAMLYICEYWVATALKYAVAMCLMKYYLDTSEH